MWWRRGPRVATKPGRSLLLRRLLDNLDAIAARLREPGQWRGVQLTSPDTGISYVRLVCKERLVSEGHEPRQYAVGAHLFSRIGEPGHLHNHRFPLAVFPFGASGRDDLYSMSWESRRGSVVVDRGSMMVRAGHAYAIEDCASLFHSVRTLRPHMSINLADVTDPPARQNRLLLAGLDEPETESARQRVAACFR